jgi:putative phosphoribosyl transferase
VWKFSNRIEAGRLLARRLAAYSGRTDTVVLALPRGGVPVAYEIAIALALPLDVFVVRKIGLPQHPELAMGAVASDGTYTLNRDVVDNFGVTSDEFLAAFHDELQEAQRREAAYRKNRPQADVRGKLVILVDDGLATGSTMQVAVEAMRRQGADKVVLAIPVAAADTQATFATIVDDLVSVLTPEPFYAVGAHYLDFTQTSDAEVRELLSKAAARRYAA